MGNVYGWKKALSGDVFTVVINGTSISYTATGTTVASVTAGLKTAIDVSAVNTVVNTTDSGTTLTVATKPGTTGLTSISATAVNGSTTATSSTVQATVGLNATGISSNATLAVAPQLGQQMTTAIATLKKPVLTTSSPAAQFALGGTEAVAAEYNFVAENGEITINELKFVVADPETVKSITIYRNINYSDPKTVKSTVVGTADVIGNTATLTNVNYTIPAGYAGKTLQATVKYNTVGLGGIKSNLDSLVTLNSVKYTAGAGNTPTLITPNVSAKTMKVVAGHPEVTITKSTDTLVNGAVKLADVKVSAKGRAIKLQDLPISVSSTGDVALATQKIDVKVSGSNVTTTGNIAVTKGNSNAGVITFTDGYTIGAGQSVTFSIYAEASGVSGAVNTNSLSTKLGSKSSLKFTDIEGNEAGISGDNIYNYPTETSTIHN